MMKISNKFKKGENANNDGFAIMKSVYVVLFLVIMSVAFASNATVYDSAYISINNLSDSGTVGESSDFYTSLIERIMSEYGISYELAESIVIQNAQDFNQTFQLLQETKNDDNTTLTGNIVTRDTPFGSDVYIELGSDEPVQEIQFEVLPLSQNVAVINEPIEWEQTIVLENPLSEYVNMSVNIHNHVSQKESQLYKHATQILIFDGGDLISETPGVLLQLNPLEIKQLNIKAITAPVESASICEKQRVRDFIPEDASIISSDIDLDSYVSEHCTIQLSTTYSGTYNNLEIDITKALQIDSSYVINTKTQQKVSLSGGIAVVTI